MRLTERWRDSRAARVLATLLSSESGKFLRTLELSRELPDDVAMGTLGEKGVFDWAEPMLARSGASRVRELHLGSEPGRKMYLSADSSFMFTTDAPGTPGASICRPYPFLGDASSILRAMPSLMSLRITGECLSVDSDALPQSLRELTIETRFLRASTLAAIGSAHLSQLETLELWLGNWPDSAPEFGGPEPEAYYGRRTDATDLDGILSGQKLPKLRRLGLTNCAWMADAVAALAVSPIAAQLETMDLSYGFLSDADVRPLLQERHRFKQLRRIDLSYNQVRAPEMQAELKAAFGKALLLGTQEELRGDSVMSLFAF